MRLFSATFSFIPSTTVDSVLSGKWIRLLVSSLLVFLGGCAAFRPASVPMRTVDIRRGDDSRCLVVLLPGRNAKPEGFAQFSTGVEARNLPIDLVAVDSHLGYYRKRSVLERLRADVLVPAKAAGYDTIWIAGTSLGGLGGMLYLRDHPEDISGVIALAPFLGPDDVIREIELAGGPRAWKPPDEVGRNDVGRELWSFLVPGGGRSEEIPIYLGWGLSDKFDRSNGMLAELLPPERVLTVPGGHDMRTWIRLWEGLLDRIELCSDRDPVVTGK